MDSQNDCQTQKLHSLPLTAGAFEPFGDVIELTAEPSAIINQGRCKRYTDLADIDIQKGEAGISLFDAEACAFPLALDMMERHPLGSQAFIPMACCAFLIVVAEDLQGQPVQPRAFLSNGQQGVNYRLGTWHAVLSPVDQSGVFAVVDRIGPGNNLEEFWFEEPLYIMD